MLEPVEVLGLLVALDDVEARRAAIERLDPRRRVNLVHPSAVVSPSAHLADNIYIGAQSVIGVQATLGRGVVQNALSSIEHDNEIGAFTMLGTGSILCGHVTTGELAFIGGGSTIKPRTYVGARTTIGAGAVVINDTDDDAVYVGNPARRIR